jgi:hypothetical protein
MTKLYTTPRIGTKDPDLTRAFKEISTQVNLLTEGRMAARHKAGTSAPTTGSHAKGDFVHNSEPAELGSASSKYIIHGWQCVASGTPGTWKECRFLTGN